MKHHCCLSSVWQGVRRISALLVCMLFTFVFVISPIKAKAEAFPIPPVWLPMNPYNAQGLHDNYVLLNDDQKEIVKEVIGAVNIVNLGFGQYVLTNPIIGVPATREFLREYGGTFLETFWTQIMGTSRAMTDFVGSTIYKASTYDTIEDYESDTAPSVASGSQKYFQISPELTVAFKNWYRANGGVENWQMRPIDIADIGSWSWFKASGVNQQTYNSQIEYWLSNFNTKVHGNVGYGTTYPSSQPDYYYTYTCANSVFENYTNLFINTSNGKAYLCTDNGTILGHEYSFRPLFVATTDFGAVTTFGDIYIRHRHFNISGFSNIGSAIDYIFSNSAVFMYQQSNAYVAYPCLNDFVKKVYVGADWSSKREYDAIDDLNIGASPSEYIDNISDTGYVDINTLIGQIADEVVNLRDVVEESVLVKDNDSAIPYSDSLQVAIDKYINQPESGVVIPSDIFGGLTGANGPVSYLWYMTKPLVSYTGDLLGLLTLEGDGTFQFTGLGYIVVGVVTIGIIGGLVTKCLL